MTTTQQQQQHQPLNTHLIPWPLLEDVLKGVLHGVELDAWYQNFESEVNPAEIEDRDPSMLDQPNMSLQQALTIVPRLRDLLDQSLSLYEVPSYIGSELEHACEAAVEQVTGDLTQEERAALDELALLAIRDGRAEPEHATLEPEHILLAVSTQDVISAYKAEAQGEDGNIPDWDDLPTEDRLRLVEACRADLINTISEKIGREIQA